MLQSQSHLEEEELQRSVHQNEVQLFEIPNKNKVLIKQRIITWSLLLVFIFFSTKNWFSNNQTNKEQNKINPNYENCSCVNQTHKIQKKKNNYTRDVAQSGAWQGTGQDFKTKHHFQPFLQAILESHYLKYKAQSIVDFGGGLCSYAERLQLMGFNVQCFEGNQFVTQNTKFGQFMDLTKEQDLGRRFEWVQSIQVGEHIPSKFQHNYIDTITKHATVGIIISWAHKGQPGVQHINTKDRRDVVRLIEQRGFRFDRQLTEKYRVHFQSGYYLNRNLLVFFKLSEQQAKNNTISEYIPIPEELKDPIFFTKTGVWQGTGEQYGKSFRLFFVLKKLLLQHYKSVGAKTIADFGGGLCTYAENLKEQGYQVECYDGNKYVAENTKFGKQRDFGQVQDLGKQFDWVQSIQVGQHIPQSYENIFADNIAKHASKGIIISWGRPLQPGREAINTKSEQQVINLIQKRGFKYNKNLTEKYRQKFKEKHFLHRSLYLFQKKSQ